VLAGGAFAVPSIAIASGIAKIDPAQIDYSAEIKAGQTVSFQDELTPTQHGYEGEWAFKFCNKTFNEKVNVTWRGRIGIYLTIIDGYYKVCIDYDTSKSYSSRGAWPDHNYATVDGTQAGYYGYDAARNPIKNDTFVCNAANNSANVYLLELSWWGVGFASFGTLGEITNVMPSAYTYQSIVPAYTTPQASGCTNEWVKL